MKDCVIVCGYPANEDGTISDILKSRIDKAIELYHDHQVQYIIVSGGAIHNQYCEALIMKEYACKHNVNEDMILIEDQAKSTYHNMMYSKEMMLKHDLETCYVITNSWHIIKARYYANKFHLNHQMIKANKPDHMSIVKVMILTVYMPFNMLINRFKGYK